MITYKKIQESKLAEIPISITCDICKKEYLYDAHDAGKSDMEIQEFHCIRLTGGYTSVFGDGMEIECDICQHCLYKLIEKYYRKININE
jgi:hypothetical protein